MTVPTDQDSPWKEILRHYFPEAIAFFFPSLHPLIDWQQPVEFLDKEFQQIAPDSETGKRYADLLVKVWRNNGPALFLLLQDYQTRWPELEASQNPFATVVMAHLKAQETKRNATARQQWKLSLIRRLYEAGYDRREVLNLFKFIDWVMILPEGLKQGFWLELKAYEEERQVPYITSVEEIGFERGMQQGRQEGRQEGHQEGRQEEARSLILRQLHRRLGELPEASRGQIEGLSVAQLEALGEALLDFTHLSHLEAWLAGQER